MEYKLKKSEFYRVAYLVAGILMFLFLFGIFNLSSFASSGSFHGWYAQENVQNESYISFLQNFDPNDFKGLSNPCFNHSWSFTITKTPISGSSDSNISVNMLIHVVTSEGDMVIGSFLCPNSGSYTQTFSGNGLCFGVPTYAYLEVIASTEWARIAGNYQITSWSFNVTPKSFSPDNTFNFSDYSSYSPVSILSAFGSVPAYGDFLYNAGELFNFSYPNYSGTSAEFANAWIYFKSSANAKHNFTFVFQSSNPVTAPNITLFVRNANNNSFNRTYTFTFTQVGSADPSIYRYYCSTDFVIPSDGVYKLYLSGSYPTTISAPSYSLSVFKGTISDYMDYVQNQWSNISPNVTQTNSNIADSVSTVGSASTYETAQFTSFDNLVTSTGVDSFSLSTVSTPLLWVGGLITTCYNNLPSAIQYLFMFVGVMGLIVIILNAGSRVVRRFGGDS